MLNGISIVCFAASYAVALCLEISRLFFRVSLRTAIMVGFVLAGLVAHSIYLTREAQQGFTQGAPLSSWYHGCLIVAWLLAAAYLTLSLWKKPTAIGLFFLPTILTLVAIAQIFPRQPQLTSETANRVWSMVHGVALLLGTAAVVVGFLGGVLYLAQSYRLKHKVVASRGLRLPSLEVLQRVSEGALIASCCLLLLGLIAGILLNWRPGAESVMPWTDPVVWPSGILLLWLLAALTFNAVYKPARQGRKVAYLTMASFIFLGLVLAIVLLFESSHGASSEQAFGGQDWGLGWPTCCLTKITRNALFTTNVSVTSNDWGDWGLGVPTSFSRAATRGDSLGRKSQEKMRKNVDESRSDGRRELFVRWPAHATASRLIVSLCLKAWDLRPRLSPTTASWFEHVGQPQGVKQRDHKSPESPAGGGQPYAA